MEKRNVDLEKQALELENKLRHYQVTPRRSLLGSPISGEFDTTISSSPTLGKRKRSRDALYISRSMLRELKVQAEGLFGSPGTLRDLRLGAAVQGTGNISRSSLMPGWFNDRVLQALAAQLFDVLPKAGGSRRLAPEEGHIQTILLTKAILNGSEDALSSDRSIDLGEVGNTLTPGSGRTSFAQSPSTVLRIRAGLMATYIMMAINQGSYARLQLSSIIRVAEAIGLHIAPQVRVSNEELEQRGQMWWSLFVLDRYVQPGHPASCWDYG